MYENKNKIKLEFSELSSSFDISVWLDFTYLLWYWWSLYFYQPETHPKAPLKSPVWISLKAPNLNSLETSIQNPWYLLSSTSAKNRKHLYMPLGCNSTSSKHCLNWTAHIILRMGKKYSHTFQTWKRISFISHFGILVFSNTPGIIFQTWIFYHLRYCNFDPLGIFIFVVIIILSN